MTMTSSGAWSVLLIVGLLRPSWSASDARSRPPASRRENRQVRRWGLFPVSAPRWSAQALADDDVAAAAARSAGAGVRRSQLERQRGELGAGGDAELAEHVAKVEVDGARADEQPGGGVPVGQPLPDQAGHLPFLRRQLVDGGDVAAAGGLPGGPQLLRGPGGPPGGAEVLEHLERGTQVRARVHPAPGAAQVLAVAEVDAGLIEAVVGGIGVLDRLLELRLGGRAAGEQRTAVCGRSQGPLGVGRGAERLELIGPVAAQGGGVGREG